MIETEPARNAFCPCGSGCKYKKCCGKNSLKECKHEAIGGYVEGIPTDLPLDDLLKEHNVVYNPFCYRCGKDLLNEDLNGYLSNCGSLQSTQREIYWVSDKRLASLTK